MLLESHGVLARLRSSASNPSGNDVKQNFAMVDTLHCVEQQGM